MDPQSSPIHSAVLQRKSRHILSSSEDEEYGRQDEVATHLDCCEQTTYTSSSRSQGTEQRKHKSTGNKDGSHYGDSEPTSTTKSGRKGGKAAPRNAEEAVVPLSSISRRSQQTSQTTWVGEITLAVNKRADDTSSLREKQSDMPSHKEKEDSGGTRPAQVDSPVQIEEGPGVIIQMVYSDEAIVWDSDADSTDSETSMPGYRQGRDTLQEQAVQEILRDSRQPRTPPPARSPSVQILADAQLQHWSLVDRICTVNYKPQWELCNWISALRAEVIHIQGSVVVLYFEKTQEFTDVPPLKSSLHTLCKVIRQHQ